MVLSLIEENMKFLVVLITFFLSTALLYTEELPAKTNSSKTGIGSGGEIHFSFNTKDFFIGGNGNIVVYKQYGILVSPFLSFRPFKKNVFTESPDSGILYQVQETRFNLGAVVAGQMSFSDSFGLVGGIGPCYSISKFHSLEISSNNQLVPIVQLGVYHSLTQNIKGKLLYEYLPLVSTPDHRIYTGILFM
jgi:hypothetical protein